MFDLEQAIAQWRREMLAAGIKTPVPLEELETHLCDAIVQRMESGVDEQQAFNLAAQKIGRAEALKVEFTKAGGPRGSSCSRKSSKTDRILGVLWLVGCLGSLCTVCNQFISHFSEIRPNLPLLFTSLLSVGVYLTGAIGSLLLLRGARRGRILVRMLALLMTIACVAQVLNFRMLGSWRLWCGICASFSLVSIWLLHTSEDAKPNLNTVVS